MKKTKKCTVLALVLILTLFTSTQAKAKSSVQHDFKSFNNAPRIVTSLNNFTYSDLTLEIIDNNKIASVEFYEIDSATQKINKKNPIKAFKKDSKKSTDTKWVYTLSHKDYIKGKEKSFYVIAKDKTGNARSKTYKIKVKNNHYVLNAPPRISNWGVTDDGMAVFKIQDNSKLKSIKIYDLNEKTKEAQNTPKVNFGNNIVNSANVRASFNLKKFKTDKNGKYNIIVIIRDAAQQQQVVSEKISFSI